MVAVIRNIIDSSEGVQLVVQRFQHKECFYSYPFDSSRLNIFKVNTYSPTFELITAECARGARKCILAELDRGSYVSIPLLHQHCRDRED